MSGTVIEGRREYTWGLRAVGEGWVIMYNMDRDTAERIAKAAPKMVRLAAVPTKNCKPIGKANFIDMPKHEIPMEYIL